MVPSKLKCHLQQKHPEHVKKDLNFFKNKNSVKQQKLDASEYFQKQSKASLTAFFEVALHRAKQKKLHTIGETLVELCVTNMVKLLLGETSAKKIEKVSLSKTTINYFSLGNQLSWLPVLHCAHSMQISAVLASVQRISDCK